MTENINQHVKEKYLDLLAEKFDAEEKVATEIINLESIMELPKGTEHFVSDLHGPISLKMNLEQTPKFRFPTCAPKWIW